MGNWFSDDTGNYDGFGGFEPFDDDFGNDPCEDDGDDLGHSSLDGQDIPDIPYEILELIKQGEYDPITHKAKSREAAAIVEEAEARIYSTDTVFGGPKREAAAGLSRLLLSIPSYSRRSFGSMICRSLILSLKKFEEKLLFGTIDRLYLHSSQAVTFAFDNVNANIRFFWDERESPYPLILANATDITENEELVYLLVGDLLADIIDNIQKNAEKKNRSI